MKHSRLLRKHLRGKLSRKQQFVLIFSLSRCGSTSIYRALNLHRACNLLHEPTYSHLGKRDIFRHHSNLLQSQSGMKHVWDPSGYPFRSEHTSIIDDIEENCETWVCLNEIILSSHPQKIIFLTRQDEKSRVISDLLGQTSDVWGPAADATSDLDVKSEYMNKMSNLQPFDISAETVRWYLDNIPEMNVRLRAAADVNDVFDLSYEDIFATDVSIEDRLEVFKKILDFLELGSGMFDINLKGVSKILEPGRKLNNSMTYQLIKNYDEISKIH